MELSDVRILFYYRSFAAFPGVSHVGLGISSTNNMKVLRQNGIEAMVEGLKSDAEVRVALDRTPGITHVVSAAPWLKTSTLAYAADQFVDVAWAVTCHSNWAFLQTEPAAIRLIREEMDLEQFKHNFHVAGNSKRYCDSAIGAYGMPVTYLPNMYYLDDTAERVQRRWSDNGGTVRVCMFGAPRKQKNMATGMIGILNAQRILGVNMEVWVNSGRNDGGEATNILNALRAMTDGVPRVTLKYLPWMAWPEFRRFARSCDAGVQCSNSETYNIVTADLASGGIPSVVSNAVTWAPDEWQADPDDGVAVGKALVNVLRDPDAGRRGLEALAAHNSDSLAAWTRYLTRNRFGTGSRAWTSIGAPEGGAGHLSEPGARRRAG